MSRSEQLLQVQDIQEIREVIKRAKVRAITTINYKYINFEQKAAIIDCLTRKLYENCLKPLKKSLIHLSLKWKCKSLDYIKFDYQPLSI